MKILCVEFENLNHFEDGKFRIDFFATDRVFDTSNVYKVFKNIYTQKIISFIGLNAAGKTTALRLLNIAINVVVYNIDLNQLKTPNMIQDGSVMRVTFFHNEEIHQLESVIGYTGGKYYYREEILRSKVKSKIQSRAGLTEFNEVNLVRSRLSSSEKKYLDDGKSIIAPVVKDNGCYVADNLFFNYVNIMNTFGETPAPIIELFDESIERLSTESITVGKKEFQWNLKFKNDDLTYNATEPIALNFLISTGTIRGQGLVSLAIEVLRTGGYLIIDELEMHLNKEIVRVILSLFNDRRTNPKGACLIFSTHYVEILDFALLDRKDNIYITRKFDGLLSVGKFSDEFKRNDFKKSEVIFSNALTGTAPKYETIQRLRDFVCKSL